MAGSPDTTCSELNSPPVCGGTKGLQVWVFRPERAKAYSLGIYPQEGCPSPYRPEGAADMPSSALSGRHVVAPLALGLKPQAVCPCPFRAKPMPFQETHICQGIKGGIA
jgi:hypothetical protein